MEESRRALHLLVRHLGMISWWVSNDVQGICIPRDHHGSTNASVDDTGDTSIHSASPESFHCLISSVPVVASAE